MTKKVSKEEREIKEFKKWLLKKTAERLADGSLTKSGITSYTKGAYKVLKKRSV